MDRTRAILITFAALAITLFAGCGGGGAGSANNGGNSGAQNQAPVAMLAITPSSGVAPLSVSASTSGSNDPDGSIAATSVDFGDGSSAVSGASSNHIYTAAGSYTVTDRKSVV